jgi:hypothetical protein
MLKMSDFPSRCYVGWPMRLRCSAGRRLNSFQGVQWPFELRTVPTTLLTCRARGGLGLNDGGVIPPFLTGLSGRIHAAIFSFCAGVTPRMPMLGRSWLYIHSHRVANSCASSMLSMTSSLEGKKPPIIKSIQLFTYLKNSNWWNCCRVSGSILQTGDKIV